jgi:catechol 2,3-dioxygenase-like lactoylglutathione lyase family enzyme
MNVEKLDHYSVCTVDLERAILFYEHALGFRPGPRPLSSSPGAWLYTPAPAGEAQGHPIVHLICVDASAAPALPAHPGDHPLPRAKTGVLDHIAFSASGVAEMRARLTRHGIAFRERKVPNQELYQVFMHDPDGVMIELNYSQPEDTGTDSR